MSSAQKAELPFQLIKISNEPEKADDAQTILTWMDEENQRAIAGGMKKLYSPFFYDDLKLAIEKKHALFFYLQKCLLGFVRIRQLGSNFWEIMSAISSPLLRRNYSGFNRLFQQESLLQIEKLSKIKNQKIRAVFIVTYHQAVAASIQKMILTAEAYTWKERIFDFSKIHQLSAFEIRILQNRLQLTDDEISHCFVFELKNCISSVQKTLLNLPLISAARQKKKNSVSALEKLIN